MKETKDYILGWAITIRDFSLLAIGMGFVVLILIGVFN